MLNRHGKILVFLLVMALLVLVVWLIPVGSSSRPLRSEQTAWEGQHLVTGEHVTEYIRDWLTKACYKRKDKRGREACVRVVSNQKRWKRAEPLGELIDTVADERHLDPLILAVVTQHESSFYEKPKLLGEKGEQGLTQVHGKALALALKRGYDMETSEGQLKAGADHLVRSADLCNGTLVQTLSKYQSGGCKTKAGGPKARARKIRKLRDQVRPMLLAGRPTILRGI